MYAMRENAEMAGKMWEASTKLEIDHGNGRFRRSVVDMLGLDAKFLNNESYSVCPIEKIIQKGK